MRLRNLLLTASVLAVVYSFGAQAWAQDTDGDTIDDSIDNCLFAPNLLQTDSGGLSPAPPDGIGDACQCGDVGDDDGIVSIVDLVVMRRVANGSTPFFADLSKCSIVDGASDCDAADVALLRAALAGQAGQSPMQVCHAATGGASGLRAYDGNQQVVLVWDAPTVVVAQYHVYGATTPGGPYAELVGSPVTSTSFKATELGGSPLVNGTFYSFVVAAEDASGVEGPYSAEVTERAWWDGATTFTGSTIGVGSSELWELSRSPYTVTNSLTIAGTLTIEPGVEVRIESGRLIRTTQSPSVPAPRLEWLGAEAARIVFDGASAIPGFWGGVELRAGIQGTSVSQYFDIRNSGSGATPAPAVRLEQSQLLLDSIRILSPGGPGLLLTRTGNELLGPNDGPTLTGWEIEADPGSYAVQVANAGAAGTLESTTIRGGVLTGSSATNPLWAPRVRFAYLTSEDYDAAQHLPHRLHPQFVQPFLDATQFVNRDPTSPIEVGGVSMLSDGRWPAFIYDIVAPGNLSLTSYYRLELAPGTVLRFADGGSFNSGSNGSAALIARGTPLEPIVFKAQPGATSWEGLQLSEPANPALIVQSVLDYVQLEDTGFNNHPAVRFLNPQLESSFSNVTIRNPLGPGVEVASGRLRLDGWDIEAAPGQLALITGTGVQELYVTNSVIRGGIRQTIDLDQVDISGNTIPDYDGGRPFEVHPNRVASLLNSNSISGTSSASRVILTNQKISGEDVLASARVHDDATWPPFRYEATGSLQIWGNPAPHLTLSPGTTIAFKTPAPPTSIRSTLEVGSAAQGGRLTAVGTVAQPIVFTSLAGSTPGGWEGVRIKPPANDLTRLEHVEIEYAGEGATPASIVVEDSGATIASSEIRDGLGDAVQCSGSALPSVRDSTIVGHTGDGIDCSAAAQILRNTITGNAGAGVRITSAEPRLRIRNNNLVANTGGGLVNEDTRGVDARLNWWTDGVDPSGQKTGAVAQNPWLTGAFAGTHEALELGVSPSAFAPLTAEALIRGQFSSVADWTLDVLDPSSTSFAGQGSSLEVVWDGTDGALPPTAHPDGTYRFELTATDTMTAQPLAAMAGLISLDAALLKAQIEAPADLAMVSGSSVDIVGTAQGPTFTSYALTYAPGADPDLSEFVTIPVGVPPPPPGTGAGVTLGTWSLSGLQAGIYTLRLQVLGSGVGDDSEDRAVVRILDASSLAIAPALISPANADGAFDEAELRGEVSSGASWRFRILDGSTVVRELTGTGRPARVLWDGRDDTDFVSDGTYSVELEAYDPFGSAIATTLATNSITIDNTPPVVDIQLPAPGFQLLDFSTDIDVEGTVTDDNDCTYALAIEPTSSPGQPISTVAGASCNLVAAPLGSFPHDLAVNPAYASGSYELVLEARDEVGNVATTTRALSVDRIELSSGDPVPQVIDPYAGQSAYIPYTLNRDADVTIDLYRSGSMGAGFVKRLLDATFRSAGSYQEPWDGTGAVGQILDRDGYYFSITATDGAGRTTVFNEPSDPEIEDLVENPFNPSETFLNSKLIGADATASSVINDAYRNDELEFVYNHYRAPGHVDIRIVEADGLTDVKVLKSEPVPPGPVVARWDGRRVDPSGSIYNGLFRVKLTVTPAERRLIFLRPPEPRLADVRTEPFLFQPTHHHVTTVRFELVRDAYVTIEVKDPFKNPVKTLAQDIFLRAGFYDGFEWDGTDAAELLVSWPGAYQIELVVTDAATGLVAEPRIGSVMVFP